MIAEQSLQRVDAAISILEIGKEIEIIGRFEVGVRKHDVMGSFASAQEVLLGWEKSVQAHTGGAEEGGAVETVAAFVEHFLVSKNVILPVDRVARVPRHFVEHSVAKPNPLFSQKFG